MALSKLTKKQTWVLIAILLAPLLIIVLASSARFAVTLSYNPDTQSYCVGWDGSIGGGGQFPDPNIPADIVKRGELFDADKYYVSWAIDGLSESIAVGGAVRSHCRGNIFTAGTTDIRYQFSINTGSGFELMQQDDFPSGYIEINVGGGGAVYDQSVPARVVHIDGTTYRSALGQTKPIIDGSILRVELWQRDSGAPGVSPVWAVGARDEAQLKSAVPAVSWEQDLYQIGDSARVHWTVPVTLVDGVAAYYLTITNMNTGLSIGDWNQKALTTTSGVAEVAVTSAYFVTGGINRIRAEIYSQIFRAAISDTATIDDINKAPIVNSVSFNLPEFREGDQVIVTISASPNPSTASPIAKYYLLASVGGDKLYDAFSTSNRISFIASRTGVLSAEATAIDQAGRSSAVARIQATVGNVIVECEAYPDLPKCKPGGGGAADIGFVIGIVLLVTGILLIVFNGILPLPMWARILLIAVGAILVLIGGYFIAVWLAAAFKSLTPKLHVGGG